MTGPNVSYGAETTAPPPFRCEGTRLWAYLLEADPDLLGALCARVFAGPSGGAMGYRPIGGHVLVTFGEVPRIVSLAAGFEDQGSVIERQVGIWVAVSQERTGRLKVFTPHMIVDNPMSFASGREVFGYNKSWGWITLPDDEGSEGCAVDVYGGNFGPTEVRGRHRLLEIRAGSGAPEVDEPHHWGDVRGVVSHLRGLVGSAASDIIGEEVAQIFLKQVRAVAGGDGTDLQEICEATIKVDRLIGWPLLREYSAVVQPLDSHPLGPELGIGSQRVLGGFRVHDLVFVLDAGEVIWPTVVDLTASGESGDGAKSGALQAAGAPGSSAARPTSVRPQGSSAENTGPGAVATAPPEVTAAAVEAAAREMAAVTNHPDARLSLAKLFFAGPTASFGRAELAFMHWEIKRGALNPASDPKPGSPWWRAVNEQVLRDQTEAAELHAGEWTAGGSTAAVDGWLAFLAAPSARTFYFAHNSSVVDGYVKQAKLAKDEQPAEIVLINLVLARVLYAHLLADDPGLAMGHFPLLAHFLGNPRTDAVGFIVDMPEFYPQEYPSHHRHKWLDLLDDAEAAGVTLVDDEIVEAQASKLYEWAGRRLTVPELPDMIQKGVPHYPWSVLHEPHPDARPRLAHFRRVLSGVVYRVVGAHPNRW